MDTQMEKRFIFMLTSMGGSLHKKSAGQTKQPVVK